MEKDRYSDFLGNLLKFSEDNQTVPSKRLTKPCVQPSNICRTQFVKLKEFSLSWLMCLLIAMNGASGDKITTSLVFNVGENVTIPCYSQRSQDGEDLSWRFSGKLNNSGLALVDQETGSLMISKVSSSDAGSYTCSSRGRTIAKIKLIVKSAPFRVINMSVHTNTVFATVSWKTLEEEGHHIQGFHCRWRPDTSHMANPWPENMEYTEVHIAPDSRTCPVYNLTSNTTYFFQIAAFNKLGPGEPVSIMATTLKFNSTLLKSTHNTSTFSQYGSVLGISLGVSFLALVTLSSGLALLLFRHRNNNHPVRQLKESPQNESLELVPHNITLNPSFNIDMLEHLAPDRTENSEYAFLVTNIEDSGQEEVKK